MFKKIYHWLIGHQPEKKDYTTKYKVTVNVQLVVDGKKEVFPWNQFLFADTEAEAAEKAYSIVDKAFRKRSIIVGNVSKQYIKK